MAEREIGYGVKKVSERVFKVGRSLLITEMNDAKLNMDEIEDGTLRLYTETFVDVYERHFYKGDLYIKLDGEWVYCDNLLLSTKYVTKKEFKQFQDEVRQAIDILKKNMDLVNLRIDEVNKNIDDVNKNITNVNRSISGVQTDVANISSELDSVKDHVGTLDMKTATLDSRVTNIEKNGGGSGSGGGTVTPPIIATDESGTIYFDTVATATAKKDFKPTDHIYINGYYKYGDGGGAHYILTDDNERKPWCIKTASSTKKIDPMTKKEYDAPLYLSINEPKEVNYRQFGAHLDGKLDDGPAMVNAHAYADSVFTFEQNGLTKVYLCKVANHEGTIRKNNNEAINCCGDVDLSGSSLIVDDLNAGWFGIFVWGDADSLYYDFEFTDETLADMKMDNFYFPKLALGANALPENTVLKLTENPYCARDDAGYLYTVARHELIMHDTDGIFSPPLADDWNHAGGEEINTVLTDYDDHTKSKTVQSFTTLSTSFTYYPSQHGHFVGCDVYMNMSSDKYNTLFWCKRHNATVEGWNIHVNPANMHNMRFRNSMIYIWDSMNVTVKNIHGFCNCGKGTMNGGTFENATSGYVLRLTNCCDVHVEDCRMQGYWGCTAMDSVKNIHFKRCHMNRLDIHDYFYNLYADSCFFYNHGIQIGYGRGMCSFTNCQWYYNEIPLDCYPSSHMVEFDLTYGRSFEGKVIVENCRIYSKNPPDGEINLFILGFSPDATTITKHYQLPEFIVRDVDVRSDNPDAQLTYFKVYGSRRAKTSKNAPSHVYGICNDNTVVWEYYGRGIDWEQQSATTASVGQIIRCMDRFIDVYKKTQFYNTRYYLVTQGGTIDYSQKPSDMSGNEISIGACKARYINPADANWQSKHLYQVGDICASSPSRWFPLYLFRCIKGGLSNGYYPTHTSGTVLEGPGDSVSEPDDCWWTYVAKKSTMFTDWKPSMQVTKDQWILAEGRVYRCTEAGKLDIYPPYDTGWFQTSLCGTATLRFLGASWNPRQWYAKDSYCVAGDNVYQCVKHDGTTLGTEPMRGNPFCVDGDIIWRYQKPVGQ